MTENKDNQAEGRGPANIRKMEERVAALASIEDLKPLLDEAFRDIAHDFALLSEAVNSESRNSMFLFREVELLKARLDGFRRDDLLHRVQMLERDKLTGALQESGALEGRVRELADAGHRTALKLEALESRVNDLEETIRLLKARVL